MTVRLLLFVIRTRIVVVSPARNAAREISAVTVNCLVHSGAVVGSPQPAAASTNVMAAAACSEIRCDGITSFFCRLERFAKDRRRPSVGVRRACLVKQCFVRSRHDARRCLAPSHFPIGCGGSSLKNAHMACSSTSVMCFANLGMLAIGSRSATPFLLLPSLSATTKSS